MANEQDTLGVILESSSEGTGFQDVQQDIKKTEQEASDAAKKIEADWQKSFAKIRNVSAVAFAAVGAAIGLSVREAAGGEAAMAAYQSSVRRAGGDTEAFGEQIDEAAMRLQRLTGIADDEFIEVAARMTDVTGDAAGSIDKLGLVADLAAARKIDLASAGDMVARAMEGELGMLSRMLPGLQEQIAALGENADKADVAATIFERLAMFEGAATDAANTTAGQFKILQQEVAATTETIGGAFLESVRGSTEGLTSVVRGVGDWAKEHTLLVSVIGGGALTVSGFLMVATGIGAVLPSLTTGLAAMNTALAVTKGLLLTIPGWGWAIAGTTAIVGLTVAVADFETEIDDTPEKVGTLEEAFNTFSPAVADATRVVNDFSGATAEGLEKAARDNAIPGISDFGDAVTETTDKIDRLNATPLKPLNLSVGSDFQMPEGESFFPGEGMAEAMAVKIESLDDEIAANRRANWEAERDEFLQHTDFLQSSYRGMVQTFADTDMSGKERRQAIWNMFKANVIGKIGEVTSNYIFGEMAKRAASVATATTAVSASATAGAAEVATANAVTTSWMQAAYAKLVAFYSWAGPLAPALAIGTIGAAFVGLGAIAAQVMGAIKMQEGGIVPGSGSGDRVPAMLEPGERVIPRDNYRANQPQIEAAISGQAGGGGTYHFHMERDSSIDEVLRLRQMFESWVVPVIERKMTEGAFTMKGVPA